MKTFLTLKTTRYSWQARLVKKQKESTGEDLKKGKLATLITLLSAFMLIFFSCWSMLNSHSPIIIEKKGKKKDNCITRVAIRFLTCHLHILSASFERSVTWYFSSDQRHRPSDYQYPLSFHHQRSYLKKKSQSIKFSHIYNSVLLKVIFSSVKQK